MNEEERLYLPHRPPKAFFGLISGQRNSGKTVLLVNLLLRDELMKGWYDLIFLCSPLWTILNRFHASYPLCSRRSCMGVTTNQSAEPMCCPGSCYKFVNQLFDTTG